MATKTKKASTTRLRTGTFLCVKDLPNEKLRSVANEFKPAVAEIAKQFDPVEAMKIMLAAIQEQLVTKSKPSASLAMALGRGVLAREELKEQEGGSLSAEEARMQLGGLSKEAILKRYRKGQLLGWREAKQDAVRFPVWQFKDGNVLPGIRETLAVLNEAPWMDDWGRILFFLNPRSSLKNTRPLDLLREGDMERVTELAQAEIG
jgi:hypothetical protein